MAIAETKEEDCNKLAVQQNGHSKKEAISLKNVNDKTDEVSFIYVFCYGITYYF